MTSTTSVSTSHASLDAVRNVQYPLDVRVMPLHDAVIGILLFPTLYAFLLQQFEAALMSHRHNICLRPDVDGVKRQGRELLHASGHAELVVACCALCYLSLDSRFLIDGMSRARVLRIPLLLVLRSLLVCRSHADSILIKVSHAVQSQPSRCALHANRRNRCMFK